MSVTQVGEALSRVKTLIDLYEKKRLTANVLVSEIVSSVTPENIYDVMDALSPEARELVRAWAEGIPDEDGRTIIFWPLPPGVTPAFKRWLKNQGRNGESAQDSGR